MRKWKLLSLLILLAFVMVPVTPAEAHGVTLTYTVNITLVEMGEPSPGEPGVILPESAPADASVTLQTTAPLRVPMTVQVEIELHGEFDSGEAMSGAQVTIYAPDDPINPRISGECDTDGNFAFTPDLSTPGIWEIQMREAGHGDWLKIDINDELVSEGIASIMQENLYPRLTASLSGLENESISSTVQSGGSKGEDSSGYTTGQILLMSGSVIWGFIGTALYFSERKRNQEELTVNHPDPGKGEDA